MPLPTLLQKNKIHNPKAQYKSFAKENRAIDYIIKCLEDKCYNLHPENIKGPEDRVFIIKAGTASGKSVTIPPELYLHFKDIIPNKSMVVSQPLIISTFLNVEDIERYYKEFIIGENIGYQSSENINKIEDKGIMIKIDEIINSEIKKGLLDNSIYKYSFIIIDEVHRRSASIDELLMNLRILIERDWKKKHFPFIILMSATIDAEYYSKKFWGADIIEVIGFSYTIEDIYLKSDSDNYITDVIETVKKINTNVDDINTEHRDILIFVHSVALINKIADMLEKSRRHENDKYLVIKFSRDINKKSNLEKQLMFAKYEDLPKIDIHINDNDILHVKPERRVILATNAIESSVTLYNLKYCVDMCYVFEVINMGQYLVLYNASTSKDSSMQRRGRVGRNSPGIFVRLCSEKTYEKFNTNSYVDLVKMELSKYILQNIDKKFTDIQFFDKPIFSNILYGYSILENNGYIERYGNDVGFEYTNIGKDILHIKKIDTKHISVLLRGYNYRCNIQELIIMLAIVNLKSGMTSRNYKKHYTKIDGNENLCKYLLSDPIIDSLLLYEEFLDELHNGIESTNKWLEQNEYNSDTFYSLFSIIDDINMSVIESLNLNPYLNFGHNNMLQLMKNKKYNTIYNRIGLFKMAFYDVYKDNILIRDSLDNYNTLYGKNIKISRFEYMSNDVSINKPNLVLALDINCIEKELFEFTTNLYMVLDGFVNCNIHTYRNFNMHYRNIIEVFCNRHLYPNVEFLKDIDKSKSNLLDLYDYVYIDDINDAKQGGFNKNNELIII